MSATGSNPNPLAHALGALATSNEAEWRGAMNATVGELQRRADNVNGSVERLSQGQSTMNIRLTTLEDGQKRLEDGQRQILERVEEQREQQAATLKTQLDQMTVQLTAAVAERAPFGLTGRKVVDKLLIPVLVTVLGALLLYLIIHK